MKKKPHCCWIAMNPGKRTNYRRRERSSGRSPTWIPEARDPRDRRDSRCSSSHPGNPVAQRRCTYRGNPDSEVHTTRIASVRTCRN